MQAPRRRVLLVLEGLVCSAGARICIPWPRNRDQTSINYKDRRRNVSSYLLRKRKSSILLTGGSGGKRNPSKSQLVGGDLARLTGPGGGVRFL